MLVINCLEFNVMTAALWF